jgi:hypothetical protein
MLRTDQRSTEFLYNPLEILAPIRKDREFDVVGTKKNGAKGKQVDLFGSQFCPSRTWVGNAGAAADHGGKHPNRRQKRQCLKRVAF